MPDIARGVVFVVLAGIAGCGSAEHHAEKAGLASKQGLPPAKADAPAPAPAPVAVPASPSSPPVAVEPPVAPVEPAVPVEPAAPIEAPAAPIEPAAAPAGGWTPPANPTDLRGDEVIPPGTSDANAKAFKKLALAKEDGVPVGGIGAGGVHIDALALGAGWESSRCADPTKVFTVGANDRVNVCMRVVHSRGTAEELTIDWVKNGKNARRSKVAVSDSHAYLTRGYLPIKLGYEGEWKAVITSADGAVLGEAAFTVK